MPDPAALMFLGADPEGALGYAGLAGNSREAQAAAGAVTAPLGALDYFGRTLRGEAPLYDPATGHPSDEAYNAAVALAGLGMTGGVAGTGPGGVAVGAGPIRAYHGSPHDFERFDLSKIGTGEGAQAYGHGLYFAENEAVARGYRDALASSAAHLQGPEGAATRALRLVGGNRDEALDFLSQSSTDPYSLFPRDQIWAARDLLKNPGWSPPPGHMYEVGIHADPGRFLDWDKPLVAQQPAVQDAFAAHGIAAEPQSRLTSGPFGGAEFAPPIGAEVYQRLAGRLGPDAASQALREAGIPGIQYLDEGSRGVGTGSLNRVVFDDRLIEILRKYGLLAPVAGGAAAAALPNGNQEQ
jgi:hypothetical protein